MTDPFVREAPDPDDGSDDFKMTSRHGDRRVLLTHLPDESWQFVHTYFGGVVPRQLYIAILRLRVIGQQWRGRGVSDFAVWRTPLIETSFFDKDKYDAPSPRARLAAAIAHAIARHFNRAPDKQIEAVAIHLSAPMGAA